MELEPDIVKALLATLGGAPKPDWLVPKGGKAWVRYDQLKLVLTKPGTATVEFLCKGTLVGVLRMEAEALDGATFRIDDVHGLSELKLGGG
jgi:hypothetical protein